MPNGNYLPIPGKSRAGPLDLPTDDLTRMASERASSLLTPYEERFGVKPITPNQAKSIGSKVGETVGSAEDKLYHSIHPETFSRILDTIMQLVTGRPIPGQEGGMPIRRAYGGESIPSQSYLVGERGPELFTPGIPGRIFPISRQEGTPPGQVDTPQGPIYGTPPPGSEDPLKIGQWWERSKRSFADPGRWFREQASQFKLPERIPFGFGELTRRERPGFNIESQILGGRPISTTIPQGGQAAPYTGPRPWRDKAIDLVKSHGDVYEVPKTGLEAWGISREGLPTGETRYTLPGTEGTMTLPKDWRSPTREESMQILRSGLERAQREREAYARGMSPERTYYEAHPEERYMELLREATEPRPLTGMAEYEASARRMRGQPQLQRIPFDYRALEYGPESPLSEERRAHAEYYRQIPEVRREAAEQRREAAEQRREEKRRPYFAPGGGYYWDPETESMKALEGPTGAQNKLFQDIIDRSYTTDEWNRRTFDERGFNKRIRQAIKTGMLPKEWEKFYPASKAIAKEEWINAAKEIDKKAKRKFPESHYEDQYKMYAEGLS